MRRPALREEPLSDEDVIAGKWFDTACQLFGGPVAFAEHQGVDLSYLTKMRSGHKPIAGRHIAKLLGQPEAALGFVAELLESIGYVAVPKAGPTVEDIERDYLQWGRGEPLLWRLYLESAAKRRGWTAEQIQLALTAER